MTTIIWTAITIASAVVLCIGIHDKNKKLKKNGINDNFIVRD